MPDDNETVAKTGSAAEKVAKAGGTTAVKAPAVDEADTEHYEEIAEYRIGEGPPPIALIVMFVLIVCWATLSWIPFFGY